MHKRTERPGVTPGVRLRPKVRVPQDPGAGGLQKGDHCVASGFFLGRIGTETGTKGRAPSPCAVRGRLRRAPTGRGLSELLYRNQIITPDFPIFGQIGHDSRFWPNRESGIPAGNPGGNHIPANHRFPANLKSGIAGTARGIGDLGSASGWVGDSALPSSPTANSASSSSKVRRPQFAAAGREATS